MKIPTISLVQATLVLMLCLGIRPLRADDVNVAGCVQPIPGTNPPLGGHQVGLYAEIESRQRLDTDTTSQAAIYSLAARGISGTASHLYVLYDGSGFSAKPVQIHPEAAHDGLRRAKADPLILLDPSHAPVPKLAAAFFADLEVRKLTHTIDSEGIAKRTAGFVAQVGGVAAKSEDQANQLKILSSPETRAALGDVLRELHLDANPAVLLQELKTSRLKQMLNDHFIEGHDDDPERAKYRAGKPLSPLVIDKFTN